MTKTWYVETRICGHVRTVKVPSEQDARQQVESLQQRGIVARVLWGLE